MTCICKETTGGSFMDDCPYLTVAYILAGLSMMLNIRLAYSSAPYALIRFRLPENLFSVFVRRMASALELWCLPSMLLGNIIDLIMKLTAKSKDEFQLDHTKKQSQNSHNDKLGILIKMKQHKFLFIIIPSILTMWSDFITYLILLIIYVTGGETGHVTAYYGVIAVSGFIFGINMTLVYAADWRYIPVYIVGENTFPMLTSIIHYLTTLIFGNRRKYNSDFLIVCIDIWVAIIISFTAAVVWTTEYIMVKHDSSNTKMIRFNVLPGQYFTDAYGTKGNPANDPKAVTLNGTRSASGQFESKAGITITGTDFTKLSDVGSTGLNITINSGTINKLYGGDLTITDKLNANTVLKLDAQGNITQPTISGPVTLAGTIVVTSSDKAINTQLTITGGPSNGITGTLTGLTNDAGKTHVTIQHGNSKITINQAAYNAIPEEYKTKTTLKIGSPDAQSTPRNPSTATGADKDSFTKYWHLLPTNYYDSSLPYWESIFPALMIMVGMGFVYCIYPGIAPGMIVPFYLIDKIETVLLVLTTFPPVIIAILQKHKSDWSPKYNTGKFNSWTEYTAGKVYLGLSIIMVIKMTLLGIFIYCLHYRDSHLSRSIINQSKMSTALSITFYMCHEILLALGFSGFIGNNGGDLILIPQYIGALLMIFLAFYSEGYIIEYKGHDPAHWPTEGMWYLYGYYQLNPNFFIMIMFNVCSDGYCDFK